MPFSVAKVADVTVASLILRMAAFYCKLAMAIRVRRFLFIFKGH